MLEINVLVLDKASLQYSTCTAANTHHINCLPARYFTTYCVLGGLYLQLIWCRLTQVDLEKGPLIEYIVFLFVQIRTHTVLVAIFEVNIV